MESPIVSGPNQQPTIERMKNPFVLLLDSMKTMAEPNPQYRLKL
jgi:hypothetical protein